MNISERIKQLATFRVSYETSHFSPNEGEKEFQGDILARFDQGEGLEFAVPNEGAFSDTRFVDKDSGLYRTLVAEIGPEEARRKTEHGLLISGRAVIIEKHVILDFGTKMAYEFELPSRKYIQK